MVQYIQRDNKLIKQENQQKSKIQKNKKDDQNNKTRLNELYGLSENAQILME